jgi:hypothetical protein
MAITSTQSKAPASVNNVAVGRYITSSTAAAFTITTGFKPRYVKVFNETSSDQEEWFEGMTDAYALKKVAAGTTSEITSLGITVTDRGFTVGLDTDINVINEQLSWIAIG